MAEKTTKRLHIAGSFSGSCDLTGYATEEYVDNAIAGIEIPEGDSVDLTGYATEEYVDNAINQIEIPEHAPGPISWNDLIDRPFYDTTVYELEEVLPETEIETAYADPEYERAKVSAAVCPADNIIVGERYKVILDGKEFVTTCQSSQQGDTVVRWLGDPATYNLRLAANDDEYNAALEALESVGMFVTGEPFAIMVVGYNGQVQSVLSTDEAGVHTLEIMHITGETGEVKTIDEKFIPDTIARVGDALGGLSSTAVDLLIEILQSAVFITNVTGKIAALEAALEAALAGGGNSGGESPDEPVADDITVSNGVMTIAAVGSEITVSDGAMTIA